MKSVKLLQYHSSWKLFTGRQQHSVPRKSAGVDVTGVAFQHVQANRVVRLDHLERKFTILLCLPAGVRRFKFQPSPG